MVNKCDKEGNNIQWSKDSLFRKIGIGKIGQMDAKTNKQKKKPDHLLTPHTRIKWIKGLNIRLETIQILEENISSKISDISHSNIFSDVSFWVRETK